MFHSPNPPTEHDQSTPTTDQSLFSAVSVELLRKAVERTQSATSEQEISLPDIIRIASARFINSASKPTDLPFNNNLVTKQVELVHCLLNAASEFDSQNYNQSIRSLDILDSSCSKTGNLTERLVYYFAQALRKRVYSKSGVVNIFDELDKVGNIEEAITSPSPIVGVIYAKIPFYQVGQLAGVQAIVESVEKSKRIHIVDLNIRNGMQWAALMQALVTRSRRALVILKITAIVMTTCENLVNETGERLKELANSMNIPFSFKAVIVPNMLEIHEKQFDLDPREAVVIFSEYALHGILPNQNELEALMVVIRHIDPTVMVVVEKEANLNSLNFAQRFVEVLFHHGAYFDCIDTCFDSDDENKMVVESIFASAQVSGILGKEKEMKRSVTVDVWRKFFRRFWMVEASLSPTTMDTVDVLLSRFTGGSCCSVDMDGRSLVVGWKGVPIFSFSTWKFLGAKPRKRTSKSKQMNTCGPVN
ncbi:DELLA protein RGL2 [Linum grandiflorum]